jgi:hypothetical protein
MTVRATYRCVPEPHQDCASLRRPGGSPCSLRSPVVQPSGLHSRTAPPWGVTVLPCAHSKAAEGFRIRSNPSGLSVRCRLSDSVVEPNRSGHPTCVTGQHHTGSDRVTYSHRLRYVSSPHRPTVAEGRPRQGNPFTPCRDEHSESHVPLRIEQTGGVHKNR